MICVVVRSSVSASAPGYIAITDTAGGAISGNCATGSERMAIPPAISVTDAVANVAAASQLVLGLERSDLALIAAGLADRLHQPARRELYPRSMELVAGARELGAIGATISGAGPSVMLWCYWQDTGKVVEAAVATVGDWAEVKRVPFSPLGADVPEL